MRWAEFVTPHANFCCDECDGSIQQGVRTHSRRECNSDLCDGCENLAALPESVGNVGTLHMLWLKDSDNLKALPASISQLTQLDEASRERVEAILRGALTAL